MWDLREILINKELRQLNCVFRLTKLLKNKPEFYIFKRRKGNKCVGLLQDLSLSSMAVLESIEISLSMRSEPLILKKDLDPVDWYHIQADELLPVAILLRAKALAGSGIKVQ